MKKIEIDQLKKDHIYHTPHDFFIEMQENVFRKIKTQKLEFHETKRGNILPLFVKYATAAAVVLVFGLIAFFSFNPSSENEETIAKTDDITLVLPEILEEEVDINLNPKKDETISKKIDNTIAHHQPQISEKKLQQMKPQNSKTTTEDIAPPIDDVLEMYSSAELMMLAQQVNQDVYLDLFND